MQECDDMNINEEHDVLIRVGGGEYGTRKEDAIIAHDKIVSGLTLAGYYVESSPNYHSNFKESNIFDGYTVTAWKRGR